MTLRIRTSAFSLALLALGSFAACYDNEPPTNNTRSSKTQEPIAPVQSLATRNISVSTDILVPDAPQDPQEQLQKLEERCDLWVTYLEQGQSPAQRSGEGLGIVRGSRKCELTGIVEDTGRRTPEGNAGKLVQGQLTVQIAVPGNREVESDVVVHRFPRDTRYDAWLDCHRAAAKAREDIAFFCKEVQQAEGEYATELRAVRFRGNEPERR
jgi:hypothetical protein